MEILSGRLNLASVNVDDALSGRGSVCERAHLRVMGYTHCPMQTPKMGILPAKCLMTSRLTPESVVGWPGPGLMMIWVGFFSMISSSVILSLRYTLTVAPSKMRYWYTFQVKES